MQITYAPTIFVFVGFIPHEIQPSGFGGAATKTTERVVFVRL